MLPIELKIHPEQILASVTHPDVQQLRAHFIDYMPPYLVNMEQDIDACRITSKNVYLSKESRNLTTAEMVLTQVHALGTLYAHENLRLYSESKTSTEQELVDYRLLIQGNMTSFIKAGNLLLRVLTYEQKPQTEDDWRKITDLIARTTQWADSFDIISEQNKLHNNRAIMFRLRHLALPSDESKRQLDTLAQLQGKLIEQVLHPPEGKSIQPVDANKLLVDYHNNRGVIRGDLAESYERSMPDQTIAQLQAAATDFTLMLSYLDLPNSFTESEKQTQRAKAYSNLGYIHLYRSRFLFEQPDSIEFSEGDFIRYIEHLTESAKIAFTYDDARGELAAELWRRRADGILLLIAVQRSVVRLPEEVVTDHIQRLMAFTQHDQLPARYSESHLLNLAEYCLDQSKHILDTPDDELLYLKSVAYRNSLFPGSS